MSHSEDDFMDVFGNLPDEEQHLVIDRLSATILKLKEARATKPCLPGKDIPSNLQLTSGESSLQIPPLIGLRHIHSDCEPLLQCPIDAIQSTSNCHWENGSSSVQCLPLDKESTLPPSSSLFNMSHQDYINSFCTEPQLQHSN